MTSDLEITFTDMPNTHTLDKINRIMAKYQFQCMGISGGGYFTYDYDYTGPSEHLENAYNDVSRFLHHLDSSSHVYKLE